LGFETARVLAKYASLVVITGYNQERYLTPSHQGVVGVNTNIDRLKLSEEALKKDVPTANIRTLHLDLSSLGSVRAAAQEVKAYPEPLHVRGAIFFGL
jgi:NAD(P)-dependent dehydrogenase (short-subunit alcohol dehydrogenase family)